MKNFDSMLDFGGSVYFLDVNKFTDLIKMDHPNGDVIIESVTKEICSLSMLLNDDLVRSLSLCGGRLNHRAISGI
jgi:hypothetical protein